MARLLSPDHACKSADMYDGTRYNSTIVDTDNPSHVRALKKIGYTLAGTVSDPVRQGGFECSECGRRNWFRRCGKCGHDGAAEFVPATS